MVGKGAAGATLLAGGVCCLEGQRYHNILDGCSGTGFKLLALSCSRDQEGTVKSLLPT